MISQFQNNTEKHQKSEQSIIREEQLIVCAAEQYNKHSRREKERSRTPRFIMVYPSSKATSSPLPTSKEFPV